MTHQYAPRPRYITPRTPGARNDGAEIAKLARLLGKPLMPWQRRVIDGITERTESGMYRYSQALITVPRQSGKTTLVGPLQLHRIMTMRNITAFYTAQDGSKAHDRMIDLINLAQESPIAHLFRPRWAAGSSGLMAPNGSKLSMFSRPSNLHSETPHLVTLDEIWAYDDAKGGDMMGAISPGQATLEGISQTVMISTRGTEKSTFMNKLIETGYSGKPGLFFADWSLADGLDPYEPKNWWTFHPALGNTIGVGFLQQEANKARDPNDPTLSHGEYVRGYANRLTTVLDPIIPTEDWDAMRADLEPPRWADVAITYDVSKLDDDDSEIGSVMATWRDALDRPCTHVVHTAPGTAWMRPLLKMIWTNHRPAVMGADDGGKTRRVTDALRLPINRGGLGDSWPGTVTSGKQIGIATDNWLEAARDQHALRHDGSRTLEVAVAHAVLRENNGVTTVSRDNSTGPVAGLIASIVGLYLFDHRDDIGEGLAIH